jgi:hypothetical protein
VSDVYCAVCGEPWDYMGVLDGDMTKEEARKFLKGKGCPACDFGKKCPSCYGKGMELCPTCRGFGNIPTHQAGYRCPSCPPCPSWSQAVTWCTGPKYETCPVCGGTGHTGLPCPSCKGTGKPGGGDKLAAAVSECEASDEDPIEILIRRGLF